MPRPGWCTTRRSATPRALVSAQEHAATVPRSTSPVRVSSTLSERPLHVMDGALIPYLGVASDTALEQVITVAETCRRFQGAFSLLWHNTSLATRAEHRQYEDLIATLASG